MMIRLKAKSRNPAEEDMQTIRLLRQRVALNDQMLALNIITNEEYNMTGEELLKVVVMLEEKYGITDKQAETEKRN